MVYNVPNLSNSQLLNVLKHMGACESAVKRVEESGLDVAGLINAMDFQDYQWLYFLFRNLNGLFGLSNSVHFYWSLKNSAEIRAEAILAIAERYDPLFNKGWLNFHSPMWLGYVYGHFELLGLPDRETLKISFMLEVENVEKVFLDSIRQLFNAVSDFTLYNPVELRLIED